MSTSARVNVGEWTSFHLFYFPCAILLKPMQRTDEGTIQYLTPDCSSLSSHNGAEPSSIGEREKINVWLEKNYSLALTITSNKCDLYDLYDLLPHISILINFDISDLGTTPDVKMIILTEFVLLERFGFEGCMRSWLIWHDMISRKNIKSCIYFSEHPFSPASVKWPAVTETERPTTFLKYFYYLKHFSTDQDFSTSQFV